MANELKNLLENKLLAKAMSRINEEKKRAAANIFQETSLLETDAPVMKAPVMKPAISNKVKLPKTATAIHPMLAPPHRSKPAAGITAIGKAQKNPKLLETEAVKERVPAHTRCVLPTAHEGPHIFIRTSKDNVRLSGECQAADPRHAAKQKPSK